MSLFGRQKEEESGALPTARASAPAVPDSPRALARENTAPPRTGRPDGKGEQTVANIGKSITIKGDLNGNEDLVIEGKVEGKVELPDNQLTVGANGTVKAEVSAKSVVVIGRVTGNVRGTDRIEIQATGVVQGDVSAPKLVVAEGAVLNGSIQMTAGDSAPARPKPAPGPSAPGGDVRKAV